MKQFQTGHLGIFGGVSRGIDLFAVHRDHISHTNRRIVIGVLRPDRRNGHPPQAEHTVITVDQRLFIGEDPAVLASVRHKLDLVVIPVLMSDKDQIRRQTDISCHALRDVITLFFRQPGTLIKRGKIVSGGKAADFIEEILIKVGFDKDLAKEGAESAAKEIFNSYSNSGYDWDDDDYDYDYDWDDDDNNSSSAKTTTKAGSSSSSATTTTKAASTSSEYISPEYDEAYIVVADKNFDNYYWGYDKGELAKGSKFVKVKGNGTFTASIDAGTADPEGFTVLGVSLSDVTDNASIKINSLKIDGQEIKLSGDVFVENDFGLEAIIYADESYSSYLTEDSDEFKNAADLSSIGKWKHIDITFEVTDNEE